MVFVCLEVSWLSMSLEGGFLSFYVVALPF